MKIFTLILFSLLSFQAHAQILQNMQSAAALDFVAPLHFEDSAENKLDIRSAELIFFGPLDPTFDATLNFAAHNEEGEFVAEVHEAYVGSSKVIPNSRFRVGKFFLGVGRLNQFHQHDWAFVSAPRVQAAFFDEEGVADTGAEFSTLLPTDSFWDITVGVTNGYTYGHSHDAGEKPQVPTHYLHAVNFVDWGDSGALQWGANYLGRTDATELKTQLYGFDFVYKKSEGKITTLLVQSELWYRNQSGPGYETTEELGAYVFPQIALSERLFVGMRVDLFSEFSRAFISDGSRQKNLNYAAVPTLTFKNSEFSLLRVAYTYDNQTYQGESDTINQKLEFQWVAILGAHPAHSF
ncbi:outer membrane beta-barrel protein [Bdellovibrio bacteriovorus]|uniref:outer membrane beta-barrel protein n=1 Tax=Bdellovibrio bacteriovorus TaxID=959 RepID=UPI0021D09E18|nr:outer membrane beta-barrel protein [Bdellovibrio bacteriovorus]UXR64288.1 outer membrane beta-barrel protein [Bdellovibrio bacteriovorus]